MMQIDKPSIKFEESQDGALAKFTIEPLERGFGITIGNAMRRVLLGGLPGAAPVAIRIQGVQHEFSTVPGMDIDVTDLILTLKTLIVRVNNDDPNFKSTIYLRAKGPCDITAGDITTNESVEIVNPELHICHLSAGANLDMEIVIGKGRGFVLAKDNKNACDSIGFIAMDSIFTPVKTAVPFVEGARVGQNMGYDKLTLEVLTNGSITAKEISSLAAKVLNDHLGLFIELVDEMAGLNVLVAHEEDEQQKLLEMSITDAMMSVRSTNGLKRANIMTIGDLVSKTYKELSRIHNLGSKSLEEIMQKIEELGLSLREDDE